MNRKMAKNRKPPVFPGTGPAVWVIFFLACTTMFVLGVLVGRNTMPVRFDMEDLNRKLAGLQRSVLSGGESGHENGGGTLKTMDEMSFEFYEALRSEQVDDFPEDEMPLRLIRPRFQKPSALTAAIRPGRTEIAETPAKDPSLARRSDPARAERNMDASRPPERAPVTLVIQVASLRSEENARTVRDKFRARGYPAYTQQAIVEGKGKWSRVRIGPYSDRRHAKKDLARLQKAGVDAILLSEDHE